MTDAPPTTGLHHVTNICTDDGLVFELVTAGPGFGVNEDEPGSEEIDPFEGK